MDAGATARASRSSKRGPQIARALQASLSRAEQLQIDKRPTKNLEAYTLFLRSLQAPNSDRALNTAAIERLRQALALDPRFALARAHLAYRLMFLSNYDSASYLDEGIKGRRGGRGGPQPRLRLPRARHGVRAEGPGGSVTPGVPACHWPDPNDTAAMNNFKNEEIRRGRLDEALYWSRRSFLRSGKAAEDFFHVVWPLMHMRTDTESRLLLDEAERSRPFHSRLQRMLAWLDVYRLAPKHAS